MEQKIKIFKNETFKESDLDYLTKKINDWVRHKAIDGWKVVSSTTNRRDNGWVLITIWIEREAKQ